MRLILLTGVAVFALSACNAAVSDDAAPSPDAARLEADVRFLADDLLEGREAGTRGYNIAAHYVAERYRAAGILPGGDDGSYFQTVPLRAVTTADPTGGRVSFSGDGAPQGLEPVADYFVGASSLSEESAVEAPMVFIGFGFASEESGRDDFEGLDLEGKIAVYIYGAPKFLNSEELAHYRATITARASEHGAVGAILLYTPSLQALYPYERMLASQQHGVNMSWLTKDGAPFSTSPNIAARAILSLDAAERLFANAPVSWNDVVAAAQSEDGNVPTFEFGMSARIDQKAVHNDVESTNVIGLIPGSDPALKDEYVVLTAHLDHEGVQPTPEEGDDEIYNGAMDNATGTAAMIEVARLLKKNPPKRSVLVVALTAEEKGLIGSEYNAQNPTVPAGQVVANVNLDMPILTYPFTDLVAFGAERSNLFDVVKQAAESRNLTLSPDPVPEQGIFTRSDQYSYVKQGVPAVYVNPGFAYDGGQSAGAFAQSHYHQPSDEIDLIDFEQLKRFTDVNYAIADGVANMDERPLWNKGDFFARTFGGQMAE